MWHATHTPYASHARINGRHYMVYSTETSLSPASIVECDGETVARIEGTIYDANDRTERGRAVAEQHAMDSDGRVEFGPNPAPVPQHVTRVVG